MECDKQPKRQRCFGEVKQVYCFGKEYHLCFTHKLQMQSRLENDKEFREKLITESNKKEERR